MAFPLCQNKQNGDGQIHRIYFEHQSYMFRLPPRIHHQAITQFWKVSYLDKRSEIDLGLTNICYIHKIYFLSVVKYFRNNTKHVNLKFDVEKKNQLDVTECFIALMIRSTCFGHFYAHHQEIETICVGYYRLWCAVLGCWLSGLRCRAAGYASRKRGVTRFSPATSLFLDS